MNDQAMKRGREEEEDRENKRCKTLTPEEEVQRVLEFVGEHFEEFAAAAGVEEALYSSFLKKIKKLVSKRVLTLEELHRITKKGRWPEMMDAVGLKLGKEEQVAMYELLRGCLRHYADEMPEIPKDLTAEEVAALGPRPKREEIARALRIIMAREDQESTGYGAREAERWLLNCEALDDRLDGEVLVEQFKGHQARVDGGQKTRSSAEASFGAELNDACILSDGYGRLVRSGREKVYSALYGLAEQIHKQHVGTYGEIVPEYGRTKVKFPRVCAGELDALKSRAARVIKRKVTVRRSSCYGPCEPVWDDVIETVYVVEGSEAHRELDAMTGPPSPSSPTGPVYRCSSPSSPTGPSFHCSDEF